jgi:hypothetical protein
MEKRRFSSRLAKGEIAIFGYWVLNIAMCTTIMISSSWLRAVWDPLKIKWFCMVWIDFWYSLCDP